LSVTPGSELSQDSIYISSTDEVAAILDTVIREMELAEYGKTDTFRVRLCLEEAAVNAVKHGHRHDPEKKARISWTITPTEVKLVVEDEGPGFNVEEVLDPRLPENLDRPSGRGLLLIRAYMTWVRFSRRGNRISMCRHRTKGK
jgi:serine/threonine-protein kinase RsbW